MCSREEYLSRCGLFWILECDPPSRWVRWVFMHPVQLIRLLLAASLFDRQKGCVLRKRWSRQALILSNIVYNFFREITYWHCQNFGWNLCSTGTHKTHSFSEPLAAHDLCRPDTEHAQVYLVLAPLEAPVVNLLMWSFWFLWDFKRCLVGWLGILTNFARGKRMAEPIFSNEWLRHFAFSAVSCSSRTLSSLGKNRFLGVKRWSLAHWWRLSQEIWLVVSEKSWGFVGLLAFDVHRLVILWLGARGK